MSGEREWNPNRRGDLIALNRAAAAHWERTLRRTPHAFEYLESRGFSDPEAIAKRYRIGYAPTRDDSTPGFVHEVLRRGFGPIPDRAELERALIAAGLATRHEESGRLRDFMYGRLIFPIADRGTLADFCSDEAHIVGFGGRYVPRAGVQDDGDGPPKWLNTRETMVFAKRSVLYGDSWAQEALKATREAILLEGYIDVIQVREAGFPTAMATLGTALTESHIKRLPVSTRSKTLTVYISTDDDAPGRKSAMRSAELIFSERPDARVRIARPVDGLDPDDLILQHGPAAFQRVLDQAMTPVARHLADVGAEFNENLRTLRSLVAIVQDVRGRLSPEFEDRRRDIQAILDWLEHHYGTMIPVNTLRRVLEEDARGLA